MPRWTDENRTPLARLRSKVGLSRNKAAIDLDIGFNTLGRYELGENDVPMGIAEKMATLYAVPFDELRAAITQTKSGATPTAILEQSRGGN